MIDIVIIIAVFTFLLAIVEAGSDGAVSNIIRAFRGK
jgi:hypothetical protein